MASDDDSRIPGGHWADGAAPDNTGGGGTMPSNNEMMSFFHGLGSALRRSIDFRPPQVDSPAKDAEESASAAPVRVSANVMGLPAGRGSSARGLAAMRTGNVLIVPPPPPAAAAAAAISAAADFIDIMDRTAAAKRMLELAEGMKPPKGILVIDYHLPQRGGS